VTHGSGFFVVESHPDAKPCQFPGSPKMLCLHQAMQVPRYVESVFVSSACAHDVLIAGGVGTNSDWLVYSGDGRGVAVGGLRLLIPADHYLTLAIAKSAEQSQPGVKCGVTLTWSEER